MKVGIITFSSAHNYGASLQVYAMQTYLEKKGHEVSVINYRPKEIDNVYRLFKEKKSGIFLIDKMSYYKNMTKVKLFSKNKIIKYQKFEYFISNILNTTEPYKTFRELMNANLNFNAFIAGSGQIWNSAITKGLKPAYFLEFAPKESIKISYAASLGATTVIPEEATVFRRYLRNFDFISVREETGREIIKNYTDKKISVVLDPTLLLNESDYEKIKIKPKYNTNYIYVHMIGNDQRQIDIAEKISQELGLPIVHNRNKKIFSNELDRASYTGPGEFLGLISDAKYVITNSFHATIFSMIYEKDFITIPHIKYPTRMQNLLNLVQLENHLISNLEDLPDLNTLSINYSKVKKILNAERKKSISFLEKALNIKNKKEENNSYLLTGDKFSCYGCYACKEACPKDAIIMTKDQEGFVYPKIDKEKCISCNICEQKCIYNNKKFIQKCENFPQVYAVVNKDEKIKMNSASGGVFPVFAKYIIKNDGYVVGVKYDANMNVIHSIAKTIDECKAFSGSKYVKSDISDLFPKIKKLLKEEKPILFAGTPCQIAGLRSYLGKDYDNLYYLELICHSNPSPKIFKKYIDFLEKKYNSKVVDFKFRDKSNGWQKQTIKIFFENGFVLSKPGKLDNYNRAFLSGLISRPSCYNCEFTKENRVGDLTMADFWGIEKIDSEIYDENGTSLLIVNNQKGNLLFNEVKDNFIYKEKTMTEAFMKNHSYPIILDTRREKIFSRIDNEDVDKVLEEFNKFKNKKSRVSKTRRIIRRVIPKTIRKMIVTTKRKYVPKKTKQLEK